MLAVFRSAVITVSILVKPRHPLPISTPRIVNRLFTNVVLFHCSLVSAWPVALLLLLTVKISAASRSDPPHRGMKNRMMRISMVTIRCCARASAPNICT